MIDDGVTDLAATFNSVSSAPTDAITDLISLRDALRNFCTERDWHQYHTPKNLVMALSVEAAELVEHFQWATAEESANLTDE
ncbi:MAG: nucleotide pyrophosphohydrolase, partial [Rhodocyclaceae bacterium]|nr:nucleotide pyrophosphohydrolase [Rhodocyclaceae bacterium]